MRLRERLRQLHLGLTLAVGALVLVLTTSGAVLVFGHELDTWLAPERYATTAGQLPLAAIVAAAEAAEPGRAVRRVWAAEARHGVHRVELAGTPSLDLWIDPGSGAVLDRAAPDAGLVGFLTDLHIRLLSGDTGKTVVGWAGLAFAVLLASGVALGWPRRGRIREAFAVRRGRGARILYFDLHRTLGLVVAPLLLVVVLAGAGIVFRPQAMALVHALALRAQPPPPAAPRLEAPPERTLPLDELVAAAEAALPGAGAWMIALPQQPLDPVVMRLRFPGELHPNGRSFVRVHPGTGEVLAVRAARDAAFPERLVDYLLFPLHVGVIGGTATRLLQVLVGLTPLFFAISGLWLWRQRAGAARRVAEKRQAEKTAPRRAA